MLTVSSIRSAQRHLELRANIDPRARKLNMMKFCLVGFEVHGFSICGVPYASILKCFCVSELCAQQKKQHKSQN